jgi:NTE family protein
MYGNLFNRRKVFTNKKWKILLNSNGKNMIPVKERALVFQGGGSLGAYEAGAYKALYEFLSKYDETEGKGKRSTFDIIAGTSIGAMNAAVLTSYVAENGTYEGSAEKLIDFWKYMSANSIIDANPWFRPWWDYFQNINKLAGSSEAIRRYYSAKEFAIFGVPNVFSPIAPIFDYKFFDLYNTWFRFSNEPLKRTLEKFAKFPIATNHEKSQPRLLLLSVDVADGLPVTFDSYTQEDGSRKTEYGRYVRTQDDSEIGFEHVIRYDQGITSDHVMASGSYPVNFDYASLEVESYDPNKSKAVIKSEISNGSSRSKNHGSSSNKHYKREIRSFWDGGLMSNTPLSQLILYHRKYWYKARGLKEKVPSLAVCIVNVHPSKQAQIPTDHDGVVNRNNDITFSDRSRKEEEVLLLISDYVDLVRDLIKTAKDNGVKDNVINGLLNQQTKYHGQLLKPRRYREIVEGSFDIDRIIRIERRNDENTISDKTFDFSCGTINKLLNDGYEDTLNVLGTFKT